MTGWTLGLDDNHAVVEVLVGEPLTIRLPELGGTAFLWHLDPDSGVDVMTDRRHFDVGMAPGSASDREIVVIVRQPGNVTVSLHRHRPWESPADADARVTYHLTAVEPSR